MQNIKAFESGGLSALEPGVPVVLLLHGYGTNEKDLVDLMEYLPKLPWFSPRAPESSPYGGSSWFHLTDIANPDPDLVQKATDSLWHWIDETIPESSPLVLLGFSQGALMATQLLRTRPVRILATVIIAGFTLEQQQPADELLLTLKPKVIYARGLQDQVISRESVSRTNTWLQAHTKAITKSYEGLGHSVDARVMADVANYLEGQLQI